MGSRTGHSFIHSFAFAFAFACSCAPVFIRSFFCLELRGCTADVIILEEAAFMKERVFFKIVAPLMGVDDTAVLAISTPDDE